jgi:hypothetical protein
MEDYQNFNQNLKSNYPRIIVNIISIINQRMDAEGKKVGVYSLILSITKNNKSTSCAETSRYTTRQ